jgi:hypothetical protein
LGLPLIATLVCHKPLLRLGLGWLKLEWGSPLVIGMDNRKRHQKLEKRSPLAATLMCRKPLL